MVHNSSKTYYEYLAKLILENYLPDEYKNIIFSDHPDLRMGDNRGIEVTRALYANDIKSAGIFNHIANKHKDSVDKRHLVSLEKMGTDLLIKDDGVIYGFAPKEGVWINDEELKREYQKKVLKYIDNPLETSINDLFIYSPMYDWLEEDVVKGFMEWVSDNTECPFANVFVFEYSYLYAYNTQTKEFRKIPVEETSREKLHKCCEEAKEFSLKEG